MAFRFAATRSILLRAAQCPRAALLPTTTSPFLTKAAATAHPFSTTPAAQAKTVKAHRLPAELIPPYPYGERRVYKQSNRGLYGSARIRYGNIVAGRGNKTRRTWRPNVHVKAFYLPALGARIKTRLTLRVLKTIRREGGLEGYLLKNKPARLRELGPGGWNMRWLLMQSQAVQRRFNEERVALGMEPREVEDRDDLIRFALDYATPGNLSARSQETLEELRAAFHSGGGAFVLGPEELGEVEGVEELTDEEEARLLQQLDEADAAEAAAQQETQAQQKQPQV
ncbi:50S ribosomal protein L24 [Cordyceps fumosorosea ARSEF 2679]|uniref:50S ribosomal protein L24 n=1 Tax=Cordyceps fumosorosea (strain ARSEF 2679) TaxID=1081104 RepID=A0A167RRZ5_CORFA|nr:50S ribosomal protein L24 [Cordyceps fumosorosea ARSEF 2679]OAA58878.1 50S ribosomal protein L24 [Cordyceps fumosorosea ARSEF 2679]